MLTGSLWCIYVGVEDDARYSSCKYYMMVEKVTSIARRGTSIVFTVAIGLMAKTAWIMFEIASNCSCLHGFGKPRCALLRLRRRHGFVDTGSAWLTGHVQVMCTARSNDGEAPYALGSRCASFSSAIPFYSPGAQQGRIELIPGHGQKSII